MQADKYQDYMFNLVQRVIDEIGPRPACSEAERKLGRLLAEEWRPICDRVDVETFTCSPHAFIGSIPLSAFLYLAAAILYWFVPPLALALAAVSCSVVVLEVFGYREFVDFLFPRRRGENVIGTIRPKGEPAQRVIVSGHMDSSYEFNPFLYFRSASILLIPIGIAAQILALGGCLAKTIAYFNVYSNDAALGRVGIAMISLSPIVVLFLFATSWKPEPGACDNMSGVSVVAGLGKYLSEAKRSGEWFPQRTEVVLLGMSSEEARMRGAKRYVKRHLKEMKDVRTYCLVMEMIKDEKSLTVLKGELSTRAKHDRQLVKLAQEAAASRNWPIVARQCPPPFATDATSFSLNGISATCLSSYDLSRFDPTYHTRYDTYEHIRPESLSVMLQLVIDMIRRIDNA